MLAELMPPIFSDRLKAGEQAKVNPNARRGAVVLLLIVGVTLLVWAGVHNGRERRLAAQKAEENHVMLLPAPANAGGGGQDDGDPKMQGKDAPKFSLVDLDGKKVSLADFKGKPILVNFWATWCGPCKLEMPWLQEFSQKYAAQGLVTLGVVTDEVPKSEIASVVHRAGVTYPTLVGDEKVAQAYGGVNYVPESFYVDRTGKVMLQTAGLSEDGKDEIEANIKKLLASGQ